MLKLPCCRPALPTKSSSWLNGDPPNAGPRRPVEALTLMEDSPTWTWALKTLALSAWEMGEGSGGGAAGSGAIGANGGGARDARGYPVGGQAERETHGLAPRRGKIDRGEGEGRGGRAGAVAHLRGPLVGVQGEFLERAGERRAPLAQGLHIGIRGGEPRSASAAPSSRGETGMSYVTARARLPTSAGGFGRERLRGSGGSVGGSACYREVERGSPERAARSRRASGGADARREPGVSLFRASAMEVRAPSDEPEKRERSPVDLRSDARARDPHSSLPLRRSDRAAAKVVSGRRARARRRMRCSARPRGECGAAAEAHREILLFPLPHHQYSS